MPVFRLGRRPVFPRPDLADEDGLLAVGGDLSLPRLVEAYCLGIFPWYEEDQPILWWSPDPRCILGVDELHVSRSLAKVLRRGTFEVRCDTAFEAVIHRCASTRVDEDGVGTWLSPAMQEAYLGLHRVGLAHSVECWREGALVGGLYGIYLGRMFCGESMFSLEANASKVALVHLAGYLAAQGARWLDCQLPTEHLKSMGAREIPRDAFQALLAEALSHPTDTRPWRWPPPPPLETPAWAGAAPVADRSDGEDP